MRRGRMRKNLRAPLAALGLAAVMTLLAASGLLDKADWALSDAW